MSVKTVNKKIFFKKRLSWLLNIKFWAFKLHILFYTITLQRFISMLYSSIFSTISVFIAIVFCSGPDYEQWMLEVTARNGPPPFRDLRLQLNLPMNLCTLHSVLCLGAPFLAVAYPRQGGKGHSCLPCRAGARPFHALGEIVYFAPLYN